MRINRQTAIDRTFAALVVAAVNGERCPKAPHLESDHIVSLAQAGRIKVDVHGKNWRVITIMWGKHAGASTAPPPFPSRSHRTIFGGGVRIGRILKSGAEHLAKDFGKRASALRSRKARLSDHQSDRAKAYDRSAEMYDRLQAVCREYIN